MSLFSSILLFSARRKSDFLRSSHESLHREGMSQPSQGSG